MGIFSWISGKKPVQQPAQAPVEEKEENILVIPLDAGQISIIEELQGLFSKLSEDIETLGDDPASVRTIKNSATQPKDLIKTIKAELNKILSAREVVIYKNRSYYDPKRPEYFRDVIICFCIIVNKLKDYAWLEPIFITIGKKIREFEKSIGLTESIYAASFAKQVSQ